MWNSLGSLRERVRESAKSAAQVAQGVLQAAAAEDDYPAAPLNDQQDENVADWGDSDAQDQDPRNSPSDISASAQQQYVPPPPPPEDPVPPPPPGDSFVSATPPVLNSARGSRRTSRYVVTGVATSEQQTAAPVVPQPSFFAPKPPVISAQSEDLDADMERENGDVILPNSTELSTHPAQEEEPLQEPSQEPVPTFFSEDGVSGEENSGMPPIPAVPETPELPEGVQESSQVDEGVPNQEDTSAAPEEISFADWGVPIEQQNDQITATAPGHDTFGGWDIPDTPSGQQEQAAAKATLPAEENFSSWNIPETKAEQQAEQQGVQGPEVMATDSFNGWDAPAVPSAAPIGQLDQATADTVSDLATGWNISTSPMEPHQTQDTAEKQGDSFSDSLAPKALNEDQQNKESAGEPQVENMLGDWNVSATPPEVVQQESPGFTTEASDSRGVTNPGPAVEEHQWVPSATENSFADWDLQDTSTSENKKDQNGWDTFNSAAEPKKAAAADGSREQDSFTDWGDGDNGWNVDGVSSSARDAGDGADWFSSSGQGTSIQTASQTADTGEESVSKTERPIPEEDDGPVLSPPASTSNNSLGISSKRESKEAGELPAPIADADTWNARNNGGQTRDKSIELEGSPSVPSTAPIQDDSAWSFNETANITASDVVDSELSIEDKQQEFKVTEPVVNSQEKLSLAQAVDSGLEPSAETWFHSQGDTENVDTAPFEGVPQDEAQSEVASYQPKSIARSEETTLSSQSPEMARQISELQARLHTFKQERDSAIAAKEESEREKDDLKRSIGLIEGDLAQSQEEAGYLTRQCDVLQTERDAVLEQKLEIEKERDEAIRKGGEGLREARNVIEAMRSDEDSTEKRAAAITEQLNALRGDLDRVFQERNSLLGEVEDLRVTKRDQESQSRQKELELQQKLQIAEHESEIARLQHEKVLETVGVHVEENRRLADAEKDKAASLVASECRIEELETYIASMQTDRDDENTRIELLSKQIEEMKERTQDVIHERNDLFDEKRNLEDQMEQYKAREEITARELQDTKRESSSLASERDEARQRFALMKEQQNELAARIDALSRERDQLVQARTAAAASSSSVSDKEKALAVECEKKTRSLAVLQKKLTSSLAKIEKLTAQRSTFHRQRDEAGARLRAAGAEFQNLTAKLEELSTTKDTLQNQIVQLRGERDAALSRVEELISIESQLKLTQDTIDSKSKEAEELQSRLKASKQEVFTLKELNEAAQQKVSSLTTELSEAHGKLEVVSREKDLVAEQRDVLEQEKHVLQTVVAERELSEKQLSKKLTLLEANHTTLQEKSTVDLSIAKAEVASEQRLHQDMKGKVSDLENEISQYNSGVNDIHSTIALCVQAFRSDSFHSSDAIAAIDWHGIDDILNSEEVQSGTSAVKLVSAYSKITAQVLRDSNTLSQEYKAMQAKHDESAELITALENEKTELLASTSEVGALRAALGEAKRDHEAVLADKASLESHVSDLKAKLVAVAAKGDQVEARLEAARNDMEDEMERRVQSLAEERHLFVKETEKVTTNLHSIWSMLRKSLGQEQLVLLMDEISQYDETDSEENVPVLALRATASIVAEVSRNRSYLEDIQGKLDTAEAEVVRLIDRAEIAEQERDSAKGTNERLEKKLKISFDEGKEETKAHFEEVISQLEDELDDTRQELSRISDKANRSEVETDELRALCSKLTSQFNGRTNELDEAEEKVVYLQDQVTTLEEDLEEAHTRLKRLEEDSQEARQSDVKRLTGELEETTAHLEQIEKECTRLQEAHEEADNIAKESQLLAKTHKQAEENLQIAIEQLEAAQESAVEQRTIDLQKRLEEAEHRCTAATEREAAASVTQRQLSIRDEEIKELRGAIGRLADERVELKLELEKCLSRLNHPDADGQLVDRRVVRQLLVSYFRVGSVRRRDVLELMSRMLAFSDSDNIAVGLTRRALMARLGSLVQAPELDDASLPPLGTVSDKWIEFLMKETEDGEDQAKGW